jgi:hypothetical protein
MQPSPDKQQSVKAIQINRARIKERIQEKHRQQSQQVRQGRLRGLREADDGHGLPSDVYQQQQQKQLRPSCTPNRMAPTLSSSSSSGLCFNSDGTVMVPVVQDWSDIGHEFGVDISDVDVMQCLLALEDEIRQEQLFMFYDQINDNEWDEYYHSLTS